MGKLLIDCQIFVTVITSNEARKVEIDIQKFIRGLYKSERVDFLQCMDRGRGSVYTKTVNWLCMNSPEFIAITEYCADEERDVHYKIIPHAQDLLTFLENEYAPGTRYRYIYAEAYKAADELDLINPLPPIQAPSAAPNF